MPPGVLADATESEVVVPLSVVEWFAQYYAQLRAACPGVVEFTAEAGDCVFVPQNWWHTVLNLEESIAITQNYVSEVGLQRTLDFLREKPDQVSGYDAVDDGAAAAAPLLQQFRDALRARRPALLAAAEEAHAAKRARTGLFAAPAATATAAATSEVSATTPSASATSAAAPRQSFRFNFAQRNE